MVVSLYETGYLQAGAGPFAYSPGHLSIPGMPTRIADTLRRAAPLPGPQRLPEHRLVPLARLPVDEVRHQLQLPPESPEAVNPGSVGPWGPGGLTPFQEAAGKALAQPGRTPIRRPRSNHPGAEILGLVDGNARRSHCLTGTGNAPGLLAAGRRGRNQGNGVNRMPSARWWWRPPASGLSPITLVRRQDGQRPRRGPP
jgi:hypothetical protein